MVATGVVATGIGSELTTAAGLAALSAATWAGARSGCALFDFALTGDVRGETADFRGMAPEAADEVAEGSTLGPTAGVGAAGGSGGPDIWITP